MLSSGIGIIIGIMSAEALTKVNGIYVYDFSQANKIYGGNAGGVTVSANVWAMAGGAGSTDHQVDNNDKNNIWYLQQATTGYRFADFNLNTVVELTDKTEIWQGNSGRSSQVPQ